MAPTAVALCGKIPSHIEYLSQNLLPDYDIIHVCHDVGIAATELPALLRGDTIKPSSGRGSNANATSPVNGSQLKAIIVGGGFPASDLETIKAACDKAKALPFFRADTSKPSAAGGPPAPSELKTRILAAIDAAPKEGGGWKPGVYMF